MEDLNLMEDEELLDFDEEDIEEDFDDISDLDIDDSEDFDSIEELDKSNEVDDTEDYVGGTPVDSSELMEDDYDSLDTGDELVSTTGDLVVMDVNDSENAFELRVIDINEIAITKRIRQNASADDMTRSIKSTGLLMPVMVAPTATDGLYVLLDGWRRLMGCAKAGKRKIPVIVNNNVSTPEIPILESMYNHARKYSTKEMVDYIEYLEKEKGIMNPSMIEYLLQMNSGDYTKLKDILNDNDEDIVDKLYNGVYTIEMAFKKLEQRRKKETLAEKEDKKAARVYDDEEESGVDKIAGSGEEVSEEAGALTNEQIEGLMLNAENLDDGLEDADLKEMVEEDKNIAGFEAHKQKTGEREYIDPAIKKAVMGRDKSTCQCCKRGGMQYTDILDYHHILPVFLGGSDTVENGIMLCVACHRMVHLYSTDDLHVDSALLNGDYEDLSEDKQEYYPNKEIFEDEKMRLKRIIKLGGVIRKGIAAKGLNKKKYKEEHSNAGIGRRKPGVKAEQEKS